MTLITSLQNPKIKHVVKLRDKKERDHTKTFLIEGYRELFFAAEAGVLIEELFICPDFYLGVNEKALVEGIAEAGASIFRCPPHVFEKISYRDRPDGLLGVARQWNLTLDDLLKRKTPLFLVAEAIEKPGNLGTMLRSCDAAGVDGLILCDRLTDIYNPNVVRASVGTLFTVPVVEEEGKKTLAWLRKNGVQIIATSPQAKISYTDVDLTKPTAILVGTEQLGLTDFWLSSADVGVVIPMHGKANSLNVASAATLLLFEGSRQRCS